VDVALEIDARDIELGLVNCMTFEYMKRLHVLRRSSMYGRSSIDDVRARAQHESLKLPSIGGRIVARLATAASAPHPVDPPFLSTPHKVLAHPRLIRLNRLPVDRPYLAARLRRRDARALRDIPQSKCRIGAAANA
jgi:hypothetical protein